MDEIRDRIRVLRAKLNLNQSQFAKKMGVVQNTWFNIEKGVNPCSDRYVNLICLTFNVRKEWLVNGQGEMFEQNLLNQQSTPILDNKGKPLPPEMAELLAIYQELVPLNQKAVFDFLQTTVKAQRNTLNTVKNDKDENS